MRHRMGEMLRSCDLGALVGARGGVERVEGEAPSGKGAAAATLEAGYPWSPRASASCDTIPGPLTGGSPARCPCQCGSHPKYRQGEQ